MDRRGFLKGLGLALAAPAIVRVENIMPVRVPKLVTPERARLVHGVTYYVTPFGSDDDSNNGLSEDQAWRTPMYAMQQVGDVRDRDVTIQIGNGTYSTVTLYGQ